MTEVTVTADEDLRATVDKIAHVALDLGHCPILDGWPEVDSVAEDMTDDEPGRSVGRTCATRSPTGKAAGDLWVG